MTSEPERSERVVLALGSNDADALEYLWTALAHVKGSDGVTNVTYSSWYETIAHTALGADPNAPRYVNGVVQFDYSGSIDELFDRTRQIETQLGRPSVRERFSDRTIDVDIICWGSHVIDTHDLTIPHPRAHERVFVLKPWLELDAAANLPGHGMVSGLLAGLNEDELMAMRRIESNE